ncbi:hypothetical protein BDZ89DRAFT_1069700 [Hymenopellis radicata]|nr:hypothetical protein BDZ89DRAFT_1069700 [Hymenopellis radicata]
MLRLGRPLSSLLWSRMQHRCIHSGAGNSTYDVLHSAVQDAYPTPTSEDLARLVAKKDYVGAERVRSHLDYLAIPIKHDVIYLDAAMHHLGRQSVKADYKHAQRAFVTWLSLVPDKHEALQWVHPFQEILNYLTKTGEPRLNVPPLKTLALVAARKGYLKDVWSPFTSLFLRYHSAGYGAQYLRKLAYEAEKYEKRIPSLRPSRDRYRALIIEACCHGGWIAQAVNMFHRSAHVRLPENIVRLLVHTLQAGGDDEGVRIVKRLADYRAQRFSARVLEAPTTRPPVLPDDEVHHQEHIPVERDLVRHFALVKAARLSSSLKA